MDSPPGLPERTSHADIQISAPFQTSDLWDCKIISLWSVAQQPQGSHRADTLLLLACTPLGPRQSVGETEKCLSLRPQGMLFFLASPSLHPSPDLVLNSAPCCNTSVVRGHMADSRGEKDLGKHPSRGGWALRARAADTRTGPRGQGRPASVNLASTVKILCANCSVLPYLQSTERNRVHTCMCASEKPTKLILETQTYQVSSNHTELGEQTHQLKSPTICSSP